MKKIEDFHGSQFSGNDENKNRNGVETNVDKSPNGLKALPNPATRKKILAERNGVSRCQNPISPSSNSRKQPTTSSSKDQFRVSPCSFKISKSDHGHENGEDESASYDPMNNFLSPRPKFLRYDPNRRRENLLGREKMKYFDLETLIGCSEVDSESDTEQGESSDCSCVSANPASPGETLVDEGCFEDVEDDGVDKEEEIEDEEEGVGDRWGLKWALKFMLVLVVLVLSTAYISSMNAPTPPPAMLAVRGLRDECQRFGGELMKYLYEIQELAGGGGSVLFDGKEDLGAGLFALSLNNVDGEGEGEGEGEEENFKEEVKDVEEEIVVRTENREGKEENFEEEISNVVAFRDNDPIQEESDTVEGFESEDGKNPVTIYQSIDGFFFQEDKIIKTGADNEDPDIQAVSSESFQQEVGNGDQIVSNGQDELLRRQKENALLAICSLVAVCACLTLNFYFKFNRSSVKSSSFSNVFETIKNPEVAEETKPKRTPRRLPTPPKPHKIISPDVKLTSELEIGNFCNPVENHNHTRSGRSEFAKEKISQKEDMKQRTADVGLRSSTTPVRRSSRIRNRVASP